MKKWILLILIIFGVAISNAAPNLGNSQTWKWNDAPINAGVKDHTTKTDASFIPTSASSTMVLFGLGLIGLAGLGRRLNK